MHVFIFFVTVVTGSHFYLHRVCHSTARKDNLRFHYAAVVFYARIPVIFCTANFILPCFAANNVRSNFTPLHAYCLLAEKHALCQLNLLALGLVSPTRRGM